MPSYALKKCVSDADLLQRIYSYLLQRIGKFSVYCTTSKQSIWLYQDMTEIMLKSYNIFAWSDFTSLPSFTSFTD